MAAGQADARLPHRLQADPDLQRLPSRPLSQPNVDAVADGIAEVGGNDGRHRRRHRHAVDTIIFGTGSMSPTPVADRITGAAARTSRTAGPRDEGLPRHHRGRLPEPVPPRSGPNTGLGHNSQVFMIESQIAYVADAIAAADKAGAAALAPTRGPPRTGSTRNCRMTCRPRCGTPAVSTVVSRRARRQPVAVVGAGVRVLDGDQGVQAIKENSFPESGSALPPSQATRQTHDVVQPLDDAPQG